MGTYIISYFISPSFISRHRSDQNVFLTAWGHANRKVKGWKRDGGYLVETETVES